MSKTRIPSPEISINMVGGCWPSVCMDRCWDRGWHLVDTTGNIFTSPSGSGGSDYCYMTLGEPLTDAEYREIMYTDDDEWAEGMGPPCIHVLDEDDDERVRNWLLRLAADEEEAS